MRAFTMTVRGIASVTLVATAMFGAIAPAHADNWGSNAANAAKTAAQSYLNAKYSSELQGHTDQLKKSEFGPFPVAHLGIDVLVDGFLGGTLVYNPATQEVKLYGSRGNFSEAQSAKQYAADSSCFGTYGMEVSIGGVPTCIPGSSIGTASTSPVPYLIGTIAAKDYTCTWTPNGSGAHSC